MLLSLSGENDPDNGQVITDKITSDKQLLWNTQSDQDKIKD